MNNLLALINSMSLSDNNRKWLAEHLIEPSETSTRVGEEEVRYPALDRALEEVARGEVYRARDSEDLFRQLGI